jgi:hypothetical protein
MLWMGVGMLSMGNLTDLRPFDGFDSVAACKTVAERINRLPEQGATVERRHVYFCLPDTVDPRAPKSKAP